MLAFGHMYGMSAHRKGRPRAIAKPITMEVEDLKMTAADMGVTFESDPEFYRAIHPIFNRKQREDEDVP